MVVNISLNNIFTHVNVAGGLLQGELAGVVALHEVDGLVDDVLVLDVHQVKDQGGVALDDSGEPDGELVGGAQVVALL